MKRNRFDWLVKNALANLNDNAALEIHPLAAVLALGDEPTGSRIHRLRQVLEAAIEALRPVEGEPRSDTVAWRPYLILRGRYVEQLDLATLQRKLALSERQLCREHSRALRAVARLVEDRYPQDLTAHGIVEEDDIGLEPSEEEFGAFELTRQPIHLGDLLREAQSALARWAESQNISLYLLLPSDLPMIEGDRIILRQIMLSLLNQAFRLVCDGRIIAQVEIYPEKITLSVRFRATEHAEWSVEEERASLRVAQYWASCLGAALQLLVPDSPTGMTCSTLSWPRTDRPAVLVVDDQEAAIRLFERYLTHTPLRVVGVRDPEQALPLARQLHPRAITMDVMMPTMDGWEVLQSLHADPDTRHIPVLVCSVWNVPDLAASLGAAGFLKKPVTQKDLLAALAHLGLPDSFPTR